MNRFRRSLIAAIAAVRRSLCARQQAAATGATPCCRTRCRSRTRPRSKWPSSSGTAASTATTWRPLIEAWAPKLPADAYFRRIPAVFNERWALDAAIYYAFEALGVLGKLHRPFFDAIHKDRLQQRRPGGARRVAGRSTASTPGSSTRPLKSFGVQSKVKRAAQFTSASSIDGTPALMVHGPLHHQHRAGPHGARACCQRRAPDPGGAQDPGRAAK